MQYTVVCQLHRRPVLLCCFVIVVVVLVAAAAAAIAHVSRSVEDHGRRQRVPAPATVLKAGLEWNLHPLHPIETANYPVPRRQQPRLASV